jgi:hypothetical protein
MKNHRKHLVVGVMSLALAGGVAGTAFAASSTAGRGNGQQMTVGTMMNGTAGTGQGMGYGMAGNQAMPIATAATYLGLTQTEMQTQLHAGKSLTAIATAQGKSVTGLSDVLTAAMTARVNANTYLTADQKAAMLAQIKAHVATMLTETTHQGATGMGQGMGQMRGRMGNGTGNGTGNAMGAGMRTA